MSRPTTRLTALLLVLSLLSACTLAPTPDRESHRTFQLRLDPAAELSAPAQIDAVLLLAPTRANPPYDSQRIAYRESAHEIRFYTRSRWADTPARMLDAALLTALERSNAFEAVVPAPASVRADYRLHVEIMELQHQFQGEAHSEAVLRLRVQLSKIEENRALKAETITARAPAPTADAEGGVAAANAALLEALQEVLNYATAAEAL